MHILELIQLLNEKGHDTSNIDINQYKPYTTGIIIYNDEDNPTKWNISHISESTLISVLKSGVDIFEFDISWELKWNDEIEKIEDVVPLVERYQINQYEIIFTDIILDSPISAMIGSDVSRWNFMLATTLDELHYILLYNPNKKVSDDSLNIFIFLKDNEIVFITYNIHYVYDKYSCPSNFSYMFKNTISEPISFVYKDSVEDVHIYNESLFWKQIEKEIGDIKYLVPRYEVIYNDENFVELNDKDRYAFDINELPLFKSIIENEDDEDICEKLCDIISHHYQDNEYLISNWMGYHDYSFSTSLSDIVESYMIEFKPYITIGKGTVIEYKNKIFPIQYDIECVDVSKLPESWCNAEFPYESRYMLDKYIFYCSNNVIKTHIKINIPDRPVLFKVYSRPNTYISSLYRYKYFISSHMGPNSKPCDIYDTYILNEVNSINNISIFKSVSLLYKDIYIIKT